MKLWCNIPNELDATSLYRSMGPLQTLARRGHVDLVVNKNADWATFKSVDAVFFQRPYLEGHLEVVRAAKINKKPVWVDFDDNLFAVPLCNPRNLLYGYPEVHHYIATMIALANVVTVSTEHLAESYRAILKQFPAKEFNTDPAKIVVINNAYDPELHPSLTEVKPPREKLVVWRGSASHCKDLWLHTDALVHCIDQHPDWKFHFIGEAFWATIEAVKKVAKPQTISITAAMDPIRFFDFLDKLRPTLVVVPLEDQAFNRSKSNIAWIEATAAGAVTLAPKWPEWDKPGVITYENARGFEHALDDFLAGEYPTSKRWEDSAASILRDYNLDDTNTQRQTILEQLARTT